MANSPQSTQGITLHSYLSRLKGVIMAESTLQRQWVIAEISDLKLSRHCYMQLLEKDANGNTIATARATIWQSAYFFVNGKFESATGQRLSNGMKVLVCLSANMSEQYGLSLNITDIAPEFTLGDMQRLRREIIERLTKEGIIDLNKELSIPDKPQRIAVISAAGAAGYGDFCNQLINNKSGIQFYTCLFAATMQGKDTAPTIIDSLKRINANRHLFDVVVIIRGGGATTDLNSFDNYELAKQVALCQLPVITGIGHERDTTVLDYVASQPVKTPTAAAEFIIDLCSKCLQKITDMQTAIVNTATALLREEKLHIDFLSNQLSPLSQSIISRENMRLSKMLAVIPATLTGKLSAESIRITNLRQMLTAALQQRLNNEQQRLSSLSDKIELLSPQNILNRGYSITTFNGHAVTDATQLKPGNQLVTRLKSGEVSSTVN
ncbi:MAG: exodeoxyribonuclease VII large subunit [Muribaculaceae bacterium]